MPEGTTPGRVDPLPIDGPPAEPPAADAESRSTVVDADVADADVADADVAEADVADAEPSQAAPDTGPPSEAGATEGATICAPEASTAPAAVVTTPPPRIGDGREPRPPLRVGRWLAGIVLVLGLGAGGLAALAGDPHSNQVVIPTRDLPAFHVIQPGDLESRRLPTDRVPADAVEDTVDAVNRLTRSGVSKGRPLTPSQLGPIVDAAQLAGRVALGLRVSATDALDGALQPGDQVDLIIPAGVGGGRPAGPLVVEGVLVLDLRPASGAVLGNEAGQSVPTFTLVVAVPAQRATEILKASDNRPIHLARRLGPRR